MWYKRSDVILFLVIALLVMTGIWVFRIISGKVLYVDRLTRDLVEKLDNTVVFAFFRWVTELGSGTFLTPFTILMGLIFWFLFRERLQALVFALGTLSSYGVNILIKHLVERERPAILAAADAEGFSFPSGHAMISMVCYGLFAYFLVKKLSSSRLVLIAQISPALLILLIGISRYVINVHYLTDVLAGFILGFIYLMGLIYIYEWLKSSKWKAPS
ncbi:phosphatidylglycerophosphatase B [Lentibacillus kapialis]|uniref:Phosphatidylglycerophosphatase B n=1 Tax=Lentibacillus kapialis TaxID=340214 RepID=A0A917PTZ6_9BACI|nr:phosphatase PAP2 family protein [Lentibacillus kapialis]GGJ92172.1 phosphatidylglycerophosphatase B [Lentibacillus kapialis]